MTSPPRRFANTHPDVVIGNFPWYEMVWRSLRGDFKPRSEPAGGYAAFARQWTQPVDPARLALVAFGGAGPLHACAIADALGMAAVVVPGRAGVLSALGCLAAPRQHDLVRSWAHGADSAGLDDALALLAAEAEAALPGADVTTAVECRYVGQSHEIRVPSVADFAAAHQQRNGYARPDAVVEVVALRATARLASPVSLADLPPVERSAALGPVVVAEPDCTIWVPAGWEARPHPTGALILTRVGR